MRVKGDLRLVEAAEVNAHADAHTVLLHEEVVHVKVEHVVRHCEGRREGVKETHVGKKTMEGRGSRRRGGWRGGMWVCSRMGKRGMEEGRRLGVWGRVGMYR